jgi:hypothetical protein
MVGVERREQVELKDRDERRNAEERDKPWPSELV